MTKTKRVQRVSFTLRRCVHGWLPIVMIGETPIAFPVENTRNEARLVAREQASNIRNAGA